MSHLEPLSDQRDYLAEWMTSPSVKCCVPPAVTNTTAIHSGLMLDSLHAIALHMFIRDGSVLAHLFFAVSNIYHCVVLMHSNWSFCIG